MTWTVPEILEVLDRCCESFAFPALDNGYIYPAATRLTAFRSYTDWSIAIEVFGYSPRAGFPEVTIYQFASRFQARVETPSYSAEQRERYLAQHPHDQMTFAYPLEGSEAWQDEECDEYVDPDVRVLTLRGAPINVPERDSYARLGVELSEPPRVQVFELCRALAALHGREVLATEREIRQHLLVDLTKLGQLEEWSHPDVTGGQRASQSETFRQLAEALVSGDFNSYRPTGKPNTHWRHWRDAGTL